MEISRRHDSNAAFAIPYAAPMQENMTNAASPSDPKKDIISLPLNVRIHLVDSERISQTRWCSFRDRVPRKNDITHSSMFARFRSSNASLRNGEAREEGSQPLQ